jgi:hypothetical protein
MVGAIQIKRIDKSDADPLFHKKTIDKAILLLYRWQICCRYQQR